MKKKERAHLKEDPFINFIEGILDTLKKFKKELLIGLGVFIAIIALALIIMFFKSRSASQENQLYTRALDIQNSATLSLQQKISGLNDIKPRKGISSAINIFLATLHFENGEYQKAQAIIERSPTSQLKLVNDQKEFLEAEILNASAKEREAIDIMNKILADGKSEIPKDFILLRIAKIQLKSGQKKSAASTLERLTSEYPDSYYSGEAGTLLQSLQ
jgi:predicted negative regulator of RcsB-dependent stress response